VLREGFKGAKSFLFLRRSAIPSVPAFVSSTLTLRTYARDCLCRLTGTACRPLSVDDPSNNPPATPSDCQNCGVCCFSESHEYIWVTGYDWTRLGEDADRLAQFIGVRAFMKMRDGHCGALEIKRVDGRVRFGCSIYERRPEICRYLGRGSPECLGELETKATAVTQHVQQF
jgi:hypothetical protein